MGRADGSPIRYAALQDKRSTANTLTAICGRASGAHDENEAISSHNNAYAARRRSLG